MNKAKIIIAKMPVVGLLVRFIFRIKIAFAYAYRPTVNYIRWLVYSRETTNFTYPLEPTNKRYLASLIADVINIEFEEVESYINEIEKHRELKEHIASMTASSEFAVFADHKVEFGRRVGWYAFARALKPKVIVETGVDKGLGACVLTAALKKNSEEGYQGEYIGTDINPNAGYLLSGEFAEYGHIIYGDSIESLKSLDRTIDLFINDSDHSKEYEGREYETIRSKLSSRSVMLGDNSHCSDKLLLFSLETGRHFLFFQEKPFSHWYPGAGIGISFQRMLDGSRT